MSSDEKMNYKGGLAALGVMALVAVFLIWRGSQNSGSMITTRQSPAAPLVQQGDTAPTLAAQAEAHFSAGRFGAAISVYRQILAVDPGNAAVYNDLGLSLHYTGKSEEAVSALQKATSLDPKLQRAWLSLGFVLQSLGRKAQARTALEKTIALGPTTPQGIEAKGMLKP